MSGIFTLKTILDPMGTQPIYSGMGRVMYVPFHWRMPKLGNEEYCRRASDYLDKVLAIIDRRADRIIKAIEKNS